MAEATFAVTYDGDAVAEGRMDVRELAPALLSMGELFREARSLVDQPEGDLTLHVRAVSASSFLVDLALVETSTVQAGVEMLTGDRGEALQRLLTIVVLGKAVAGGTIFGLISLIKVLKGRAPRHRERQPDGTVIIETEDGDTLTVTEDVMVLYDNPAVRQRTHEVIKPVEAEGIDRVSFGQPDAAEPAITVSADEAIYFAFGEAEEALLDQETEAIVDIVAPSFADGKWRLSTGGDGSFTASIEDPNFRRRVDDGEQFAKGDMLRVRMHIYQTRTEKGGLSTDRRVLEVLEHIPRTTPVQGRLDDIDDDA